jgi:hypothetical protein
MFVRSVKYPAQAGRSIRVIGKRLPIEQNLVLMEAKIRRIVPDVNIFLSGFLSMEDEPGGES